MVLRKKGTHLRRHLGHRQLAAGGSKHRLRRESLFGSGEEGAGHD